MFEVKVYDSSGNLKKVIPVDQLNIREKIQWDTPSVFHKNKRTRGTSVKLYKSQANGVKP